MNAPAAALTEQYLRIPLEQLQESKTNPRRHVDKTADGELAASIKQQGVVEPVIVRPHPGGKGYELVAGARRLRQSKVAGVADIPAIVRHYSDTQAMEVQIVENLQRKDVHPYDEAFGFKALLDQRENGKPRYDVPAIAAKVGKSVSYVYMRLKLTDLVKEAQDAFLADKITAGHAEKIARLQPKQQKDALTACTRCDLSVRELAEWIDDEVHLDLANAPFKTDDATLVPSAKACTTCPKRTGTQPDLFADLTQGDICTDPGCFKAKVDANTARVIAGAKTEGKKIIKISTKSYDVGAGVLDANKWKPAARPCAATKLGLMVSGWRQDRDQIGNTQPICDNTKCKLHWRTSRYSAASSTPKKSAAQALAEKQKKQAAELTRHKAMTAALDAYHQKPVLALEDLISIADSMLETAGAEFVARVCAHQHIDVGKRGYMPALDAMKKTVRAAKAVPQAMQLICALHVACVFSEPEWRQRQALLTDSKLAKRFGIDMPKLEGTILAEIKAKDKALAAAAQKAKGLKKKKAAAAKLQTSANPKANTKKGANRG